jgi:hypothetical protein
MKRIKFIIMLFLASVTVTSFAQSSSSKFTLGIFGGLNIPRLTGGNNNEMTSGYSSREGAAFGLTSDLDLGSNFSLRADLLYSSEGGKRNGLQAVDPTPFIQQGLQPTGKYFYANFNNESILDYLELPILLKYSIPVQSSSFYIDFGPYAGYLLKATQKTSGKSTVYYDKGGTQPVIIDQQGDQLVSPFNATTDVKSSIHKMNFGITGGIGYAQHVGKDKLILDVRGAYGLTYIQKDPANGKSHTGNLLISLGYSVPL